MGGLYEFRHGFSSLFVKYSGKCPTIKNLTAPSTHSNAGEFQMQNPFNNDLYFINSSIVTNLPKQGTFLPVHYGFVYMLKGELTYITDKSPPQTVHSGDLYCMHTSLQTILEGAFYQSMFVSFNGKKAGDFMRSIGHGPDNPVVRNAPDRIRNLMQEIMKALPTKKTHNPYFFINRITAIAETICEINQVGKAPEEHSYSRQIRQTLEQMDYQCPGTTELAKKMDVNQNTLRQACLRETGMPAKNFLVHLKLERAKELLRTTSYKVEYIALTCGYSNDKHFYKSFRLHTGTTPSRWRETQKNH
ncbi:helix-turn-helix domain-containing protein [Tichowtungia aerotolerans]|uniref:Helix-turn-helix domain-containing protein n=1 Tax=Tichowtungia aerotolerans TaxID=2697043 RepID=A0A6P1MFJ6_9BACT|nr:AraC family transcriptional regulator [Tichowtungia aerotolerans]QHI70386.1 helix-turn-helix domain-containing protein [Tichowtungia aerotolerans]